MGKKVEKLMIDDDAIFLSRCAMAKFLFGIDLVDDKV
jgi:hypothetical protein